MHKNNREEVCMKYHFMQDKNMTMTTFAETFRKRKKEKKKQFCIHFLSGDKSKG
jgi:hypothetical protein